MGTKYLSKKVSGLGIKKERWTDTTHINEIRQLSNTGNPRKSLLSESKEEKCTTT